MLAKVKPEKLQDKNNFDYSQFVYQTGLKKSDAETSEDRTYDYYDDYVSVAIVQVGAMPFGFGGHAEIIYEDREVAENSVKAIGSEKTACFKTFELGNRDSNVNASTMSTGIGGMATISGSSSNVGPTRNSSSGNSGGSSISGSTFLGEGLFEIKNVNLYKQHNDLSIANNMKVLQMDSSDFASLKNRYKALYQVIHPKNEQPSDNQESSGNQEITTNTNMNKSIPKKIAYKLLPTMKDFSQEDVAQINCASLVADLLDSADYKMENNDPEQTIITPYLVSTATWGKK